jgi:hypothetical protein
MLPQIESFGAGGLGNRRLHLLELAHPEELDEVIFPFEGHVCVLLVWHSTEVETEFVGWVAKSLLDRGAVSISCWGDGCHRAHETLGEIIAGEDGTSPYSSSTMTTWHARESFDEALWYALFIAQPTDLFESSCRDSLVVLIDQPENSARARAALENPERFSAEVLARGTRD